MRWVLGLVKDRSYEVQGRVSSHKHTESTLMVVQGGLLTESYLICKELEPHKNTFTSLVEKETIGLFLEVNSPPVVEVK